MVITVEKRQIDRVIRILCRVDGRAKQNLLTIQEITELVKMIDVVVIHEVTISTEENW